MTTTDLYSGYDRDGKPTSRVLRPPGGGSSNIFGSEPAPQQQLKKQEQKEMLDSNQNQALNKAPQPTSQSQDVQPQPKRKGASSYNPITGEEYPEDYGKKKGEAVKNDEETDKDSDNNNTTSTPTPAPTPTGTTGSNSTPTTTGTNSTPTSAKANIRPSSRVLQPPGGASTGLW